MRHSQPTPQHGWELLGLNPNQFILANSSRQRMARRSSRRLSTRGSAEHLTMFFT